VALIVLLALLSYFCYFKPRRSPKSLKAQAPAAVRIRSKKRSRRLAQKQVADVVVSVAVMPSAPPVSQMQWACAVDAPIVPAVEGQTMTLQQLQPVTRIQPAAWEPQMRVEHTHV